tara:strand:+ start:12642 stop:13733 length:1092 start_codon:yes stop_codon:yes gene_type:complete
MNFVEELKRRKVIKVGITYAVVAFIFMQLVEIIFPIFNIPLWVSRLAIILIVMGFPIVFILAWIFDVTPDGIVKTDSSSQNINSFLMGSLQILFLLAVVLAFTNPKKNYTLNQVKKRLILFSPDEDYLNEFIEKSISIRSYLFFSVGRISVRGYDYNVTHGILGKVYTSNLLPDIYSVGIKEAPMVENKKPVDIKITEDITIDKGIDIDEKLSETKHKKEEKKEKITEFSVSNTANEDKSERISSVDPINTIKLRSIRQYDFSAGRDIIARKKLTIYLTRASFGPASIYELPTKDSQIISTVASGRQMYVFPIFREDFLVVGTNNIRPLGYVNVGDVQFPAADRLSKIKEVSKANFLDSSEFE